MPALHWEGSENGGWDLMTNNGLVINTVARDGTFTGTPRYQEMDFVETAGAGTYTATVTLPAGAAVTYVAWETTAGWAATTAAISIGYTGALTQWASSVNCKAATAVTDAPVAGVAPTVHAAGTAFTAVIVTTGAGGTTGRTRVFVGYTIMPTAVTPTKV